MNGRNREQGFTVVELMITLAIMTIVSVMLLSFLMNTTTVTAAAESDTQAERDAQLALRVMSQDIRAANPILAACGTGYGSCLSFTVPRPTASNPNCVSSITYRRAGSTIVKDRADAGCAQNRSDNGTLIIPTADTNAVFSYLDRLNRPIGLTQACSSDPSQAACVPQAKTVRIHFTMTYQGQKTAPLRFDAAISLRNNR